MENKCVCCGADIPEGRMVCPKCQIKAITDAAKAAREKTFVGALDRDGGFRRYTKGEKK